MWSTAPSRSKSTAPQASGWLPASPGPRRGTTDAYAIPQRGPPPWKYLLSPGSRPGHVPTAIGAGRAGRPRGSRVGHMWLSELSLVNFRNFRHLRLEARPGVLLFCGQNGQGKTNLLEAVYVLATTRSPRTNVERELLSW